MKRPTCATRRALARFGQAALDKREPQELVDEAIQTVIEGLGADAVVYVEPGPRPGELVLRAGAAATRPTTAR